MSAQFTLPKDARTAIRDAQRVGFVLSQGSRHYKLRCPDNQVITISCSCSDTNAARAVIRDIRKARERCGV